MIKFVVMLALEHCMGHVLSEYSNDNIVILLDQESEKKLRQELEKLATAHMYALNLCVAILFILLYIII